MNNGYFGIERDNQFSCFCQACCVGKPTDDMSPDPRYCQSCYDFLLEEAELLSPGKHPAWIPRVTCKAAQCETKPPKQYHVSLLGGAGIMSTLKAPTVMPETSSKRGPKHKALPDELIKQWAGEGMGSKAIATKLKGQGIVVSYKTVQRVLSAQKKIRVERKEIVKKA